MKLPAMQFYVGDWRKDPGVQSLDYEARGVWFEILCLMHESERRGVLLLNGKTMPQEALARLLGVDQPMLQRTLAKLSGHGVISIEDETGAYYCRRMVRDEAMREQRKADGASGGNPALKGNYNEPGFVYAVRRSSDGAIKIGIARNVKNRFAKLRFTLKGENLTLEGVKPSGNMGLDEAALHREHSAYCIGGEWFKFPPEIEKQVLTLMGKSRDTDKGKARASSSSSVSSSDIFSEMGERADPELPKRGQAEAIYAAYPRKVGKKAALGMIAKALREVEFARLLERTQAYAKAVESWPEADKGFVPYPATWFNRGSYDDDPQTWVRTAKPLPFAPRQPAEKGISFV